MDQKWYKCSYKVVLHMMLSLLQSLDSLTEKLLRSESQEKPKTQGDITEEEIDKLNAHIEELRARIEQYKKREIQLKQNVISYRGDYRVKQTETLSPSDERFRYNDMRSIAQDIKRAEQQILDCDIDAHRTWQTIHRIEREIQELNMKLHYLGRPPRHG